VLGNMVGLLHSRQGIFDLICVGHDAVVKVDFSHGPVKHSKVDESVDY